MTEETSAEKEGGVAQEAGGGDVGKVAPAVFVSYSHDSEEHSGWVLRLAERLRACGVDVTLDQWDVGLGDDLAKFMEKGVSEADRVLMVCTEAYVRKADEGKGGVGYEAMVVTGELVRKLQTNKFIPIVRQQGGAAVVPKSVCTRLYVNLSSDEHFDDEFEKLLREIHNTPRLKKPALGRNPFAGESGGWTLASPAPTTRKSTVPSGELFYARAVEAARRGDLMSWRQVLKEARRRSAEGLEAWRAKWEAAPPKAEGDLPRMVDEAFSGAAPIYAVAVTGVESGEDRMRKQLSVVDELLNPANWPESGRTVIVDLPDTLVFLYQALHGAVCLQTGQVGLAIELARSRFQRAELGKAKVLMEKGAWVGWPRSISQSATVAWEFLVGLPDRHPWLVDVFGSKDDYVAALSAYYSVLSTAELANLIAGGHRELLDGRELHFGVPLCGCSIPNGLVGRAYRYMTADTDGLRYAWENVGVSTATMLMLWPEWIQSCKRWLGGVYRDREINLYFADLFQDPGLVPLEGTDLKGVKT
jgi:hypothetical protein